MATIIEIQEKVEHLSEYAEKVMKYGKKMMECLEEIGEQGSYQERSRMRKYDNRHPGRYDDSEYNRYY